MITNAIAIILKVIYPVFLKKDLQVRMGEPGKILLELAYIFASVYVINWE